MKEKHTRDNAEKHDKSAAAKAAPEADKKKTGTAGSPDPAEAAARPEKPADKAEEKADEAERKTSSGDDVGLTLLILLSKCGCKSTTFSDTRNQFFKILFSLDNLIHNLQNFSLLRKSSSFNFGSFLQNFGLESLVFER